MPHNVFPRIVCGLFLTAALAPLAGQDNGFTKELKVRWAYAPSIQDNLRHASQGFGLNLGFPVGSGKLGVELGYYYKAGDNYYLGNQADVPTGLQPYNPERSGDARRNKLDGFNVRLSYQKPVSQDISWQVGVMVGGTRFKHEYVGDVQSQNWDGNHPDSWRDTYSGVPTQGGFNVSPYVGVATSISKRSSLEFNVMLLGYKALAYRHFPGSGHYEHLGASDPHADPDPNPHDIGGYTEHNGFSSDGLTKTNRYTAHVEIAYVFHF